MLCIDLKKMDVNELHRGQKQYSQQHILLPCSIVRET